MPDRRRHRGAHAEDGVLFGPASTDALRAAVSDLTWLLGRGYPKTAALKLVGDRHRLRTRQRRAVLRVACPTSVARGRLERRVEVAALRGEAVDIDGFNALITVESALSGAVVLEGLDSAYRDLASLHGSYRRVAETRKAIELIGATLAAHEPARVTWYLDSPVSNSGRLATWIRALAEERRWPWSVETVLDPDGILARTENIVASSDAMILDACTRWTALSREVVQRHVPDAWVLALGEEPDGRGRSG